MANFVRYTDGEWSALYKDGKLVVVGDSYLSDDYLANYLEVDERNSSDYFLGREKTYENAESELVSVETYSERQLEAKASKAAMLRAEAARLLEEADNLPE